ncbi:MULTISPECIES: ACP S-malonyltransferase [Paenibacillus]|uniref:Malonyl CoA-acyl carrier protein transacylase n=1 Tax=Paenibacillus campinasensis TaxID=66347 RepID=A0ABW9SXG7_9BACL|nr:MULTISPECIES: ACP S-malonyltransferase [Paenibacillus]MUG65703.1 acyltransferase domain-containing protein [Paenibacillus campinasensis]PAK54253.1 hypothetical protein CHH75_08020 [Paenibacillus sp. 7541]
MKKTAFVFPGQSSQRIGMLTDLYRESERVRHTFEEASDAVGLDIARICLEGHHGSLQDISISAPVIVTAGIATFRHLQSQFGITPAVMAGHSLGEYTALACAGVFTLEEVLPAVVFRSRLAQRVMEEEQGVMTVITKLNISEVEELCRHMRRRGGKVWTSCLNAESQVCVGGREADLEILEQQVLKMGGSLRRLIGNAPYHTPLMSTMIEEFGNYLQSCQLRTPQFPVVANVSTRPYTAFSIIDNLLLQLQHSVKWHHTIDYIQRQHIHTFIELGSGQILSRLLRQHSKTIEIYNYETAADRNRLASSLSQLAEVSA